MLSYDPLSKALDELLLNTAYFVPMAFHLHSPDSHDWAKTQESRTRTPVSVHFILSRIGGWNHAEDTVPHKRVTVKPPGRVRDSGRTT
jgi:hypothetical protein